MDPTRELVDAGQVGTAIAILSGLAFVATLVLGYLGLSRRQGPLVRASWLTAGGALLGPLWLVYNAIEDHFGLDSVAALAINTAIFVAVGVGMGLVVRRSGSTTAETATGPEASPGAAGGE